MSDDRGGMAGAGALFVVSTPIGNLRDISERALATLKSVDLIAAEDTRHTGRLLAHFGIVTPTVSLHAHNERGRIEDLLQRARTGMDLAIVSDAGTPLVSDPGGQLVRAARQAGLQVVSIPGASALLTALTCSGLNCDQFVFEGFLPRKGADRARRLQDIVRQTRTIVLYESPKRIGTTLAELAPLLAARECCLCRELTKLHEEVRSGTAQELAVAIADGAMAARGEMVLLIAGAEPTSISDSAVDRLLDALADELPASAVSRVVARYADRPRQEIYQRLQDRRAAPES